MSHIDVLTHGYTSRSTPDNTDICETKHYVIGEVLVF